MHDEAAEQIAITTVLDYDTPLSAGVDAMPGVYPDVAVTIATQASIAAQHDIDPVKVALAIALQRLRVDQAIARMATDPRAVLGVVNVA